MSMVGTAGNAPTPGSSRGAQRVRISYPVAPQYEAWVLKEEPVPESVPHDVLTNYLKALLVAWAARTNKDSLVARNLAVRWIQQHPQVGVDPDICVIQPRPPNAEELSSLRTWEAGHSCPRLAIEVVSDQHPYKDYGSIQDKYASLGTPELWILDNHSSNERSPRRVPLQLWLRADDGTFERVHADCSPFRSPYLNAWVHAHEHGVSVSDDRGGEQTWLTAEEQARQEAEQLRTQRDRLAAELAALRR